MPNSAKVLVIGDSTTFCLIMVSALEKAGYQVITTYNGKEGLAKALQERPHCAIIDVVPLESVDSVLAVNYAP